MNRPANPYEPPTTSSKAHGKGSYSARKLQFTSVFLVFGCVTVASALIASTNQTPEDSSEDRRDILIFFLGIAAIFGIAGSYLTARYIVDKAPLFSILITFGLFAVTGPFVGGPNYNGAMKMIALIAAITLLVSTTIAYTFRRLTKSQNNRLNVSGG